VDCNLLSHKIGNRLIIKNLHLFEGVVYDLGCGERPYEKEILTKAASYIGVDWGNTLHELKADIVADLNKPLDMIDAETADTVACFSVLEHIAEPQTLLNEAFRILKPKGILFLTVPFQWWVHEAPYDYFRYTRYGLEYMLKKAGFRHVHVEESAGFWYTWFMKFNYHSCRWIRGPFLIRQLIKCVLISVWFLDQCIAPFLDRIDWNPAEAGGYCVVASK
jgi:SAM-dependent methyltransferase